MKPRVYHHRRPIPEPKDPAHFQILVDELESKEIDPVAIIPKRNKKNREIQKVVNSYMWNLGNGWEFEEATDLLLETLNTIQKTFKEEIRK